MEHPNMKYDYNDNNFMKSFITETIPELNHIVISIQT